MRYDPRPGGIERDVRAVLGVLAVAVANMERLHYPHADEVTTAGTCWVTQTERKGLRACDGGTTVRGEPTVNP